MKIATLQLNAQGLSSTKLYNYIRVANKQGVKVLLLGEYVLNPFFKELQSLSYAMIKEQTQMQIKVLNELSTTYAMTIIAPLVLIKNKKPYKAVVKFAPNSTSYYYQQKLINYPHWNEEKFFAQPKPQMPLIFKVDDIRFGVINGFELHFDRFFAYLSSKKVDCILVPSVSTFESYERWKSLIVARSITHNCYILRANRIGSYKDKEFDWEFYGDSLLCSPHGELLEHLGDKEELMIGEVFHSEVIQAKKIWGFGRCNQA